MAEFLELVESFRANDATTTKVFGGEGVGARNHRIRQAGDYERRLVEAARLMKRVYRGERRALIEMQEAMTTSDFPYLFGDIIDREMLGVYERWPTTYQNYCRVREVRDFRQVSRFSVDGAEGTLDIVPEQDEYPAASISENRDQYQVQKRGRRIPFSWESMINDDLDALKDIPERFGQAGRSTEEYFATGLFVTTTGPHGSLYSAGTYGNVVTGNPVLSVPALQTALTILGSMVDVNGIPIVSTMVELVVPPALEITALNILNSTELWLSEAGGTSNTQVHVMNWMRNRLRLNVNPYIPLIASSSNGNTSWFLFASASTGRPALEIGFLRGYRQPQIFIKAGNQVRVGGGTADPMDGDFDTDSVDYKVRHVLGGTRLVNTGGARATVASNGSGS